jgi:hypothetical protein
VLAANMMVENPTHTNYTPAVLQYSNPDKKNATIRSKTGMLIFQVKELACM